MGDQRLRVRGPEQSLHPLRVDSGAVPEVEHALGKGRIDGRGPREHRKLYLRLGAVNQAAGSAFVEVGKTKVVVACYGPKDHDRTRVYSATGLLECEFKYAPFSRTRRVDNVPTPEEREASRRLVDIVAPAVRLEHYPKSLIELFVLVLEDDGGALPAAIHGASCALVQAGIELLDVVTACTTAFVGDQLWTDATALEATQATSAATVALMPALGEVCGLLQEGRVSSKQHAQAVEQATACCSQLHRALEHVLLEQLPQESASSAEKGAQ